MITRTFESSSSSAVHTAKLNPETGESSCTCQGWRFKRGDGPRSCKHTRQLETERTAAPASGHVAETVPANGTATSAPVKPMLASAMTKGEFADYCNDCWLLEQKFDGHRVIVRKRGEDVIAWSRPRSGKDALVRQLPARLADAVRHLPDGIYDGELVTHGGKSWDVSRVDADKVLVLFDVIELMGQSVIAPTSRNRVYHERRAALRLAVEHHARRVDEPLITVPDSVPVSWEAVETIWAQGGEGAILKRVNSTYQPGKRSADWVKVKKSGSAVLTLIGYEAGKCGPYSVLKLRADDGRETTVKTLTNALRAEIAGAPSTFIGRRVVLSFCELTDSGSFRHGIFDHFAGEGE